MRRAEATLHTPLGAVTQLLGLVARPSAGSLGDVLRSFVLRQAQLAGVRSVCGVTRCREWTADGERSYAEHVEKGSDRGLRFHLNAGARMRGLVAGYRPEDAANEGHGVLIEFCLGKAADDGAEMAEGGAALRSPLSLDGVKLVVAEVVDGLSYGAGSARDAMQTGFMELGLDSVDVVQLIDRLNSRLPSCGLAPTAVFAHPTPAALSAHIFDQLRDSDVESQQKQVAVGPLTLLTLVSCTQVPLKGSLLTPSYHWIRLSSSPSTSCGRTATLLRRHCGRAGARSRCSQCRTLLTRSWLRLARTRATCRWHCALCECLAG